MDPTTKKPVNVIQVCAGVSQLNIMYIQFTTLSISLTFARVLQFLTFSKKLSAFQEIMFSAAFDLLFFCLLWAVMLFGFAIPFFASFGLNLPHFKEISTSFFQTFKLSVGSFIFDEMSEVDTSLTVTYFIVFQVIYRILLTNMFIAIVSAHYF